MRKHHPENERVKRKYFTFLKEAKRQDDASVDAAAKAISRSRSARVMVAAVGLAKSGTA